MRNTTLLILLLVCIVSIIAMWQDITGDSPEVIMERPEAKLGQKSLAGPLPPLTVTALDGTTVRTTDLTGKILLLHFWASWCAPCLEEFPALLDFVERYPQDVRLLAFSVDHDRAAMERFLSGKAIQRYASLMEGGAVYVIHDMDRTITQRQFDISRFPETIVVNSSQQMARKIIGAHPFWDEETPVTLLGN